MGAIIGALIGAASTEVFNRSARAREDWARTKLAAFSLYQKLNQIYSDALQFRSAVDESIERRDHERTEWDSSGPHQTADGVEIRRIFHLWLYHEPYAGAFERVTFTSDELWALPRVGDDNLLNRVNGIDRRYNAQLGALERYGQDRDALGDQLRHVAQMESVQGVQASMSGGAELASQLAIPSARLDQLLETIRTRCDELARETYTVLAALLQARKRPLGAKARIQLPDPDGLQTELRAVDGPSAENFWRRWARLEELSG